VIGCNKLECLKKIIFSLSLLCKKGRALLQGAPHSAG
jgi:hypothetical protein